MPYFKFKCLNCGRIFEEQARTSYDKVSCPNCKSRNVTAKFPASANSSAPSSCG